MDTDSFVIYIETEDFYKDIANDVEKWFDTSNYDENDKRPLPIGKNNKVIGLFKDELAGKIMKEFVALRAKTYANLMDDDSEKKKAKGSKKRVIKRRLMFKNYTDCQFNDRIILQSQQRFKSDHHNVYTEQINKIALINNDDKTLQTFDKTTAYPHRTNAFKVYESEMLLVMLKKGLKKMIKDGFSIGKYKIEFSFFKDELGEMIMKEFAGPRELMFKSFTDCMFNDKIILKLQQKFKSDCYNVYT